MGLTVTIPPAVWMRVAQALWLRVEPLDDPLLRQEAHRVDVHDDGHGRVWLVVEGANAGVRMQSAPPDQHDFASTDGGPL
jgi:hypothetical protein